MESKNIEETFVELNGSYYLDTPELQTTDWPSYPSYEHDGSYPYPELSLENSKDIMEWRCEDCMTWAQNVCISRGIDINSANISNFAKFTGEMLTHFTLYDFLDAIDNNFGDVFHQEFSKLLDRRMRDAICPSPYGMDYASDCPSTPEDDYSLTDLSPEIISVVDNLLKDSELSNISEDDIIFPELSQDSTAMTDESDSNQDYLDLDLDLSVEYGVHEVPGSPCTAPAQTKPTNSVPSSLAPFDLGSDILGKIKTKSRKRERGPKNWEYLMRLLADKSYNPKVIRWEDKQALTFRIVKPNVVAEIWGKRSRKPRLTYDNFARGLRYHYKTGALNAVSERQLVYKCGPKAIKYLDETLRYASQ